jgi:hypothetical protein
MRRVPKLSFGQGQLMLWILAGSLVAFVAMFVFLHVSGVTLTTTSRELPHINWMPPAHENPFSPSDPRYLIAEVFDPSLMTLPSIHGFSSGAWRRKIEATQRSLGWNEQPAFLDAAPPAEPRSLLDPTPVDVAVLAAAEKTQAFSEESNDIEGTVLPVAVNQSVVRILGALEERAVVSAPQLPTITSPALRPTQIRVGVGADGQVLYALLDQSCKDDAVDAQALALAGRIRFEAEHDSSASSLTWGVLKFLWATQPPATTNVESTAAQP